MCRQLFKTIALVLVSLSGIAYSIAEEPSEKVASETEAMENQFSAMLKGATLKGTWAAVGPVGLGEDKQDGYQIVEAKKVKGDKWVMVSRFEYKGQQMDIPVPVVIKFAGDTAVMILNDLPTGDGATWSARILFHNDVYTGSWWESTRKKGGILSGIVSREAEEKGAKKEKKSLPDE
jgi:hypothetical protein